MESGEETHQDLGPETTLDPNSPLSEAAAARGSDRLLSIYEVGRQLLEQEKPTEVIQTIHQAIVNHLDPDYACVLKVADDGSYQPLATHNLDLEPPEEEWELSHTVCSRVRETGLALLTFDAQSDRQLGGAASVQKFLIRSLICVPLGRKPVQGLIYLDNRDEKRPFRRDDLEFVTALSLYTSLVLARAEEYVRTADALKLSGERLDILQSELLRYQIVGRSPGLLAAYDSLRRFARAGARVLLRGETGTGKELFARAYADNSARRGKAYVPVPIPALAPTLVESELFGHVRGAFTEARQDKKGRLEVAHGGILFLDEVGDIEPALQPKLLRFLDSGELYRVGDTKPRHIDALVVSATNLPVEKLMKEGRFRADFLARLGQVVSIPPLRERPEDIPLLIEHFVTMYDRSPRKKVFADETMELLKRYRWEFNIRQLQQVIERVVCLVDHTTILPDDLPDYIRLEGEPPPTPSVRRPGFRPVSLKRTLENVEKDHIVRTLEFTKGNKRKAIEILQISPDTFYKRLEQFGLHKKQG